MNHSETLKKLLSFEPLLKSEVYQVMGGQQSDVKTALDHLVLAGQARIGNDSYSRPQAELTQAGRQSVEWSRA